MSITGSMSETLGKRNPFRYRGYYYDTETGMYYLKNRYYDPEIRRFISTDSIAVLEVQNDLYDKNLYAYCDNNPIMRKDTGGGFWTIASGAVIEFGMQIITGGKIDLVSIELAALGGAAGGALTATGFSWCGQIVGNAGISTVTEVVSQVRNVNRDLGSIALHAGEMAIVGGASVAIGGNHRLSRLDWRVYFLMLLVE